MEYVRALMARNALVMLGTVGICVASFNDEGIADGSC